MKFLIPDKPIFTCTADNCENCVAKDKVTCHFTLGHLVKFLAFALPAFVLGGIGTFMYAWWAFAVFFISMPLYFGFLEIRVMCSHCPHYAEPSTSSLKCWANYGSPKIWKYRPGPMSFWEKFVFISGMIAVFAIPVLFMVLGQRYILLAAYVVYLAFGFSMLLTFLCKKCMNFACPFNRVKKNDREKFFYNNPKVKDAWEDKL